MDGGVGNVPPNKTLSSVKNIKLCIPERMFFSSRLYVSSIASNFSRVNEFEGIRGFLNRVIIGD